jgi:ribonuclease E
MLINVLHPEEARVAIVQDGRLMELNIEISGKEQTKGNIYKGVVVRVEPGLQAAFVDIGHKKPGFIQMGDLHPDSWQWRDDLPEEERKRRPRIQDVVRRGQELIVQVEKDARDMKGAALTSYLSLPGRYMVLMPGDDAAGISRKIEDNAIRKELKALVAELQVPTGYGYIVRTEAVGRSSVELKKDLDYLIGVHERILQQAAAINGAGEVYQDAGVIIRTIRDYFSDDIDEVLVDDKSACQQAVDFFKEIMPGCERLVKLHKEKRPIFSKYQLEEQIDQLYEKRVPLPSGGSLIIEPTEALVSIDVNSGKSSGEKGVEDTAFKTNLEAAAEVARQLRLRDLGGLVVIDFIDMRDNKHNKEVERTLKDALKMDKARVNLGRISQFGMMEMSRQRIAKNINDAIHLECPHCEGRGRVKSVEAMAVSFLRKVHAAAAKGQLAEVHGALPLDVAYYLLNRKKRELTQIENDYEIVVTVKGKPSFLLNQLELEAIRKEKTVREEEVVQELAVADIVESTVEDEVVAEGAALSAVDSAAKKKRKRRRKKKSAGERQIEQVADEVVDVIDNAAGSAMADVASEAVVTADLVSPDTPVRKRPRRTRAKKKDIQQGTVASKVIDETTVAEDVTELGDQTLSVPKKRSRQRKSTRNEMADILVIDNVAAEQTVANKPSPPKKSRSKKTLPQNDETSEVGVMAEQLVTDLTEPIKQVKKKASVRQKKVESLSDVPTEE